SVVLLNKVDLLDTSTVNSVVREVVEEMGSGVPVLPVSALRGDGLDRLGETLFRLLDLVRVYTKPPNGKPSDKPLVVRRGATVIEVAKAIHSRLYREFAYARIWGPSARYPGQKVGADHVVEDGDVVEIHTRR
ncbi:MAG: GTP-binding protein, partial [Thermoprotei archaeon]